MKARAINERVSAMGSLDWDRRLFDSLIPLPDGTSYNVYLIRGSEKTALIDAVDPSKSWELMDQLRDIERIDYIISQHTEQDHSGTIPAVMAKYPEAKLVASTKAKTLLADHLHIPADQIVTVADGEKLSLGDRNLTFIHTPWVHWPETMCTWLEEDKILFSCDLFGSHLATSDLFATDEAHVTSAAKRYFAEIMMPFRKFIVKHLEKLAPYDIGMIAPSHGPVYGRPGLILDAYRDWVTSPPRNRAVIAYVSMHDSTRIMVDHLTGALMREGVGVDRFDLVGVELGSLAMALVDAATLIIGTPTVLSAPHPLAANAAYLANMLQPKTRFAGVIGSYGWASKTPEILLGMLSSLQVEKLDPVQVRGLPTDKDRENLDKLAATIAANHAKLAQETA